MPGVALRPVEDSDLDALSDQMRDPEAVRMAAFTAEDPDDRGAFDAHMARLRNAPDITLRAVTCDGQLAGTIASFFSDGQTEVTYWIDRASWGRGIATRALALLLDVVPVRPGTRPAPAVVVRTRPPAFAPPTGCGTRRPARRGSSSIDRAWPAG